MKLTSQQILIHTYELWTSQPPGALWLRIFPWVVVFTAGLSKVMAPLGPMEGRLRKKQPGLLDVGKQQLDDFGRLQTVVLKLSSWLSFICWFYKCRWLAHGWDCRKLHALYITMLFPTWLSGITRCFSPRRGARLLAPASFITLLLVLLLAAAIRCYYHNHPLLFWPCFVLFFIFGDISKQRNVSLRFWDQQTFHVFRAKT